MAKNITLQTIQRVYNLNATTPKSFGIADLWCGSGHNTLSIIKQMLEACTYDGYDDNTNNEFRMYPNDLPNNDFNAIFKALPDFYTELRRDGKGKFDLYIYIYIYRCLSWLFLWKTFSRKVLALHLFQQQPALAF